MPADSVHCCVTSPPYWGLRDYGLKPLDWGGDPDCRHRWGAEGKSAQRLRDAKNPRVHCLHPRTGAFCGRCGAWRGSLGLEPDYRLYVDHLVAVLREVRRVLRPDGTLWLNLGDCYVTTAPGSRVDPAKMTGMHRSRRAYTRPETPPGLKPKDLVGIPWRVAFALQDDGWWLRRDHIWAKPNPMPESCVDRCTTAHEYLFLLTKSARYYYDAAAIREPFATHPRWRYPARARIAGRGTQGAASARGDDRDKSGGFPPNGSGRNKRSVWTIPTAPFAGPHFATYPPALVEPCILAGCPAGATVLDPFIGSGTTAMVADRLGRHCIGIDLDPASADMTRQRMAA